MIDEKNRSRRNCEFKRPDGTLCRGWKVEGSKFCFMHSPDRREQARKARSKGGKRYDEKMGDTELKPPDTLEEIQDLLSMTTKMVWDGKCDVKRADAIIKLCKMQLTVIKQAREEGPPEDDIATMGLDEIRAEAKRLINED